MKTIWKFLLDGPECKIGMPKGAEVIHVAVQREQPYAWALVDESAGAAIRTLRSYGTGHPVPEDPGEYIGTLHLESGSLIFHVFDAGEETAP